MNDNQADKIIALLQEIRDFQAEASKKQSRHLAIAETSSDLARQMQKRSATLIRWLLAVLMFLGAPSVLLKHSG